MEPAIDPEQEAHFNELLIRVTSQDIVIGSGTKKECHLRGHPLNIYPHRAFSLFLFDEPDSEGKCKLLMQQRSCTKPTFPNLKTNTCCSHPWHCPEEMNDPLAGVKRATIRKVAHELGIKEINLEDMFLHSRIHYAAHSCDYWQENELDYVLVARKAISQINPNPQEVSQASWISRQEFKEQFIGKNSSILTPWVKLVVQHGLLWEIWDAVENGEYTKFESSRGEAKLPEIHSFIHGKEEIKNVCSQLKFPNNL
jgi:isopentenyl-diphosphate delta-isomerase